MQYLEDTTTLTLVWAWQAEEEGWAQEWEGRSEDTTRRGVAETWREAGVTQRTADKPG